MLMARINEGKGAGIEAAFFYWFVFLRVRVSQTPPNPKVMAKTLISIPI